MENDTLTLERKAAHYDRFFTALKAIAEMRVDEATDYRQLLALVMAIARVTLGEES